MAQWGAGFQYPLQTGYNNPQFQQQNPQFQQQNPQFQQQQPPQQQFQQQTPQFQPQQQPQAGGFGAPSAALLPQQTGYPVQRQQFLQQPPQIGFQQPQQTGFAPQSLLQQQPTGFVGGSFQQQTRAPPPPPPVPALPPQFQRPNNGSTFLIPQNQQQQQQPPSSGFLSPSPALGGLGMGIAPQQTGFAPRAAPLVPQMTGYVDPRLQMMSATFMPSTPFGSQLAPPPQQNLVQSIQQHNEAARGTARQTMSWALTKAEKKNYNDIFRNWDAQNTGFISGPTALEVFGASGLPKDDLARIWTLADIDDRGKLNMQEFHVAMGLIYRRLNGMPIPDQLPPELIPPSARDLDESVEAMKSLLQYENRSRSPSSVDSPISRLKNRSFNTTGSAIDSGRDATIYKHSDSEPPGGFYKPRSRHVDRDAVRRTDDVSPSSDLSDMKRQLASTAQMLDRASEATAEDEELDREMDDLKYRVKRVQDDIDYVSRGPKSVSKDEERRKLERELLSLMHERVPEVERKIKARDERKEREKRQWARDRDRANERFGRYDDQERDRDRDYGSRPYSRNERGYERDEREGRESRNRDRDREGRESRNRDRDRDRDREYDPRERDWDRRDTYDRPRSTAPPRSPPPTSPSSTLSANPTGGLPPPKPTPSPAPLKNMTPEERKAYAREQAQQRIEARKLALGVITPSSTVVIDTAVEDRLQQDKKEAEEKAKKAEREREERERVRRERVEGERAAREPVVVKVKPTPTVSAAAPVPSARAAPPVTTPRSAPPVSATKTRAPAPPPPRKPAPRQAPVVPKVDLEEGRRRAEEERVRAAEAEQGRVRAAEQERIRAEQERTRAAEQERVRAAEQERIRAEQERIRAEEERGRAEEEKFRAREEALRKQREERSARMRQLEKEEQEQERLEEERYRARVEALKARSSTPKVVEPTSVKEPTVKPQEPVKAAAPAVIPPATPVEKSTNPFSRLLSQGASAPTTPAVTTPAVATNGNTNPWAAARPQTAPPPSSKSPVKASYQTVPAANEDDWDIIKEKDESDDDSSDDELAQSRTARANIAQQLFGSMLPRPQSSGPPVSSPSSPAPVGAGPPPPPAPAAMFAPPPATAAVTPAAPGDVSALMQSIQGGMKLRPTKTVDKSAPPVSGRVIGDTAPPLHIDVNVPTTTTTPAQPNYPERKSSLPQPTSMMDDAPDKPKMSNRQSVGWFTTRAADAGVSPVDQLPATMEGEEEEDGGDIYATPPTIPSIQVDEHVSNVTEPVSDLMADIDKSIEHRARSLYAYEGDGAEDLSFAENLVLIVNPSKSGSDWWYGTTLKDGKSGLFPKTYIEVYQPTKAKAIYAYETDNTDEYSFEEGDEIAIIDKSDAEWWKTEQNGVVLIVPAAYLEDVEDASNVQATVQTSEIAVRPPETIPHPIEQDVDDSNGEEEVDDDSDSDSCDSEYLSFDDTHEHHHHHHHHPETDEERIAREREKQLVLEAAGLIVNQDTSGPPPKLVRAKSKSKRRPAPAVPTRTFSISKDLPPVPVLEEPEPEEIDHATRLDDAFARYESFRDAQLNQNRLSVVSTDSSNTISTLAASSPTSLASPTVLSPSHSQGRESEGGRYSQFLHFLTRSKTPEQGDRKSTLVISAPIMSTSTSAASFADEPSRTNSPSFGTSWASLVDKTALEGIPPGERKRQEAIFELINTEVAYVRDLQLIVEVFYSSMLPLLSTKEITVVFANIEDILLINTGFVSLLEERQKDCRLYVDRIGDILLNHLPNMGVYMEYCVNQGTAIKVLHSLRNSNPELAQHLQRLRDDPSVRNLDLSSYLLAPMQRITRYPLLIKQIQHYTEVGEELEAIKSARDISEKLLDHINETIRDQEGRETLKRISQYLWVGQGRLDLSAPTRYMGARKLIKQGILLKTKSGRKLQAFLCSDILVLTDELARTLYRMPIPLAHAQVMGEPKDDCTFKITQAYPRGGDSISLKALSARDCQQWIQEIDTSGRRCRHAEERAARKAAHRRQ